MINKTKKEIFFIAVIFLITIAIYYPLIVGGKLTGYDDQVLLSPLIHLKELTSYFQQVKVGNILDVQPIRDLSYLTDIQLSNLLGFETYYLSNVLLLFGLIFVLRKILIIKKGKLESGDYALLAIFATSPLVMSSVGWVAARKHLLSAFFIFLATKEVFEINNQELSVKNIIKITLYYLAAILSHPINLFWPLFPFITFKNNQKPRALYLSLSLIFAAVFFINTYYYKGIFVNLTGGEGKFESSLGFSPGMTLLALGRYFYSILNPLDYLPTSYFQGSWQNIAGLFLLFIFLIWIYFKNKKELNTKALSYLLLVLIPLLPVTISVTRIFCSQTYFLSSMLGVVLFVNSEFRFKKKNYVFFLILIVNVFCSIQYVRVLGNENSLFEFAYNKEKTPISIVAKLKIDLALSRHKEVEKEIDELKNYDETNRYIGYFITQNIYLNMALSIKDKVNALEKSPQQDPYYFLILSLLYSNSNDEMKFKETVREIYLNPKRYLEHSYLNNELTLALYRITCEKFNYDQECKKVFLDFSKVLALKNWNPSLYANYYQKLKSEKDNLEYK